jgi:hypothetical protein
MQSKLSIDLDTRGKVSKIMPTPKFLFNVADTWLQAGSLIIFSDRPYHEIDHEFGDQLELRRPDGTPIQAESQIILVDSPTTDDRPLALSMGGMTETDIPVGTQVWLVNPDRPPVKLHRKFGRMGE